MYTLRKSWVEREEIRDVDWRDRSTTFVVRQKCRDFWKNIRRRVDRNGWGCIELTMMDLFRLKIGVIGRFRRRGPMLETDGRDSFLFVNFLVVTHKEEKGMGK